MSKEMREQIDKVKNFKQFLNESKNFNSLSELNNLIMNFDEPIEYRGKLYATIFGPNYRDTSHSTMEGDVSWNSENVKLLSKINKEVFDNKGNIIKYKEDEPIYTLYIELEKLGLTY